MKWFVIYVICFVTSLQAEGFLVYGGKTGWIGQKLVRLLKEQEKTVYIGTARLENREALEREIAEINPDFIINAAGVTGVPNVDWCEDHQQDTIRGNVIGALNLADVAYLHQIHVTNFGTGCIYEYDDVHTMGSQNGFTETDEPNFEDSFYSKTKLMLDRLLTSYPNVLNLRLRLPISSDLHPRNLISKITKYQKVVNVPNSITVLDDLLPVSIEMAQRKLTGNYNFTNPGTISHNEILALYKEYVDPQFTWTNFTLEEQSKVIKAPRSNNHLDVSKLLKEFPDILPVHESVQNIFKKIASNEK